jgi:MYXO-CTERM domain-containing protein
MMAETKHSRPSGWAAPAGRWLAMALVALVALSLSSSALALGTVQVASSTVDEDDGRWKLKFTIDYGKAPDLPTVPTVFEFKQVVLYELSLTDEHPDKPVERRVPIQNATPINLPMDVSFSDVSGNLHRITKFTMPLTRDADFEAGEYELTVRMSRGGTLGNKMRIILKGKNKVINRKSISFEADAPKPKPKSAPDMGSEDTGPKAAEDLGPDLSDIPDDPGDETTGGPKPVDKKQGGCGCRVAGTPAPAWGWASLALAALPLMRRRRRKELSRSARPW